MSERESEHDSEAEAKRAFANWIRASDQPSKPMRMSTVRLPFSRRLPAAEFATSAAASAPASEEARAEAVEAIATMKEDPEREP